MSEQGTKSAEQGARSTEQESTREHHSGSQYRQHFGDKRVAHDVAAAQPHHGDISHRVEPAGNLGEPGKTVEAGERLGYLPGGIAEKLAPYLRPLNDALNDRLGSRRVKQLMAEGSIEIAPIGFMRGRTLNNAFIVIDEAQNCT